MLRFDVAPRIRIAFAMCRVLAGTQTASTRYIFRAPLHQVMRDARSRGERPGPTIRTLSWLISAGQGNASRSFRAQDADTTSAIGRVFDTVAHIHGGGSRYASDASGVRPLRVPDRSLLAPERGLTLPRTHCEDNARVL